MNTAGQRIDADGTPLNSLHVALLEAFGIEGSFGNAGAVFGDYSAAALSGIRAG